jgi:membrane protease YdiL (CAAX protease family)
MSNPRTTHDHIPTEHLARAAGVIALAAVAIIHVSDLSDTLEEIPLIGYGYLLLIAATLATAAMLMTVPGPRVWALANLVASGAILAYVLSRTTGLPTDTLDVGNWNCALGTAAISTETLIVLLAAWRMQPQRLLLGPAYRNIISAEPKVTAPADSAG